MPEKQLGVAKYIVPKCTKNNMIYIFTHLLYLVNFNSTKNAMFIFFKIEIAQKYLTMQNMAICFSEDIFWG